MKNLKNFLLNNWIWTLLLVAFLLLIFIPKTPYFRLFPGKDASGYIYFAQRILEGEIPYRDLWNHKGPAVWYVNVLGVLLSPYSFWGVWFVELIFFLFTMLLAFFTLSAIYNRMIAFAGVIAGFSFSFWVGVGGNPNEVYSLLPIFLSLFLFLRSINIGNYKPCYFTMGVLFAWSFLYRGNNTGLFLALFSLVAFQSVRLREWREGLSKIFWSFLGFAALNGIVIIYFAINEALQDYIEIAYLYNFAHASTHGSFWNGLISGISVSRPAIFLVGLSIPILLIDEVRNRSQVGKVHQLRTLTLFSILAEIGLVTTFGRGFEHYYIMWIPMVVLSSSYVFYFLQNSFRSEVSIFKRPIPISNLLIWSTVPIMSTMTLGAGIWPTIVFFQKLVVEQKIPVPDASDEQVALVIDAINRREEAVANPYMIVWGFEPIHYLVNQKISPTRWFFQYGLVNPNYVRPSMLMEFYDDIREYKPIILDVSNDTSEVPSIGHEFWDKDPHRKLIQDYIGENYVVTDPIGPFLYRLYVPKTD